ncbi:MAG: DUF4345 domain-containing protein [Deltaproteobacteria bacterium]|nr:DUF4345 domain-containing protein [Deltaproteobacteria bacterium]
MNPRVTTIVVGLIIFALGVCGLVYPERVLGLLGLTYTNPAHMAAAMGEIRATYGGIFIVMGVYTLFAAVDPAVHRTRVLFVGLLWLGACAGRLFGVYVDGSPGLPGWGAVVFELVIGGALVVVAQSAPPLVVTPVLERAVHDAVATVEPPPIVPPA